MAKPSVTFAVVLTGAALAGQPLSAEPAGKRAGNSTTANVPAVSVPAAKPTAEQCASPTADNAAACDSLFATMIEYQKMMNKEQREDARLKRESRRLELDVKAAKIKTDNKAIDQGMAESREKADAAQQSAQTELVIGVAGGTLSASAGAPPAGAKTAADACRVTGSKCEEPCKEPCD